LKDRGAADVLVVPIGFLSDHMEVIFDLDVEARQQCEALGLNLVRASTVGTHPVFITALRQLIEERLTDTPNRLALGHRGPSPDICPDDCCLAPSRAGEKPE
jgi:ferrochelatase